MNLEKIKKSIRNIPDFPVPGIQFKDVTTLFKDPDLLSELSEGLYAAYKEKGITKVVGIESRGFIIGPLLAERLHAGFIPIRKPGKLPAAFFEESYAKEYGTDSIQIHQDAISSDDVVLLHDDLLATGGTMKAAVNLIRKFTPKKIYVNFLIELENLKGRNLFEEMGIQVDSIIKYGI
jgi:adenine phosphoribosyltransferase